MNPALTNPNYLPTLRAKDRTLNSLQRAVISEIIDWMDADSEKITGMTLARRYNKKYDATLDWHLFSGFLDELSANGSMWIAGHTNDGMTIYCCRHIPGEFRSIEPKPIK